MTAAITEHAASRKGSFSIFIENSLLYNFINWYAQRFPFPFRGWKYFRKWLQSTGNGRRTFLKKLHNGLLMRLAPHEHIQQQLFWYGVYEAKYVRAWESVIPEDGFMLDIGANIGYYSLVAAKKAPAGQVFAFEPQEAAFRALQDHAALNKLSNITSFRLAVSDSHGGADLFLSGSDNSGMTGLSRADNFSGTIERVQTIRLDDWAGAKQWQRLDVVKMDIEGAEYRALSGMTGLLRQWQPILFVEVNAALLARFGHRPADMASLLHDCGYRPFQVNEDGSFAPCATIVEDELLVFIPQQKKSSFDLAAIDPG